MSNTRTDVNTLGEFGLIDHLTKNFQNKNKSSFLGIGDDAGVIEIGDDLLLTTKEILSEGIHFDLSYFPLHYLGFKAVVMAISDILAMNGTAQQIMVAMAMSNRYSVEALEQLYKGIHEACEQYGVDLIGGDTTSSPKGLSLSITAIGKVNKDKITYRSGAQKGDIICLSGDLGASYLGIQILEREKRLFLEDPNLKPEFGEDPYFINRYLKPHARLDIIEFIRKAELVPTSMIDISDGLSSDLFHIAKQSNVGLFIEEAKIPVKQEVQLKAIDFKLDPSTIALHGGEDYELCFTIKESDLDKIQFMPDVSIIGEITDKEDGLKLHTSGGNIHNLKAQGWRTQE